MQSEAIHESLAPAVDNLKSILKNESGQFMILGPDKALLQHLVYKIRRMTKYKPVQVVNSKDENPNDKIFFIFLKNTNSLAYQSLLYHYLELPETFRCFVCFVSRSTLSLNFFEKRVRSRFKNRIFFLPYLDLSEACSDKNTGKSELSTPNSSHNPDLLFRSLENRENLMKMEKYNFERFSLAFLFDLFEPIHFVLIMISHHKRLVLNRCYDQFKMAVDNAPEIKKVDANRVLYCYYDLVDAGVINTKGAFVLDYQEFQDFINNNAPQYIKRLMKSFKHILL